MVHPGYGSRRVPALVRRLVAVVAAIVVAVAHELARNADGVGALELEWRARATGLERRVEIRDQSPKTRDQPLTTSVHCFSSEASAQSFLRSHH